MQVLTTVQDSDGIIYVLCRNHLAAFESAKVDFRALSVGPVEVDDNASGECDLCMADIKSAPNKRLKAMPVAPPEDWGLAGDPEGGIINPPQYVIRNNRYVVRLEQPRRPRPRRGVRLPEPAPGDRAVAFEQAEVAINPAALEANNVVIDWHNLEMLAAEGINAAPELPPAPDRAELMAEEMAAEEPQEDPQPEDDLPF